MHPKIDVKLMKVEPWYDRLLVIEHYERFLTTRVLSIQYAGHITEENEKQKEEIDALNGEVKDLTRELVSKKGRRSTAKDADLAAELEKLEEKMGKVRDKLANEQAQTSKLKDKLADSEAAKTQAVNSKMESDAKIRDQTKRIDDLGKELLKAMTVSKNAELQSKESNKVKGDTVKETRRLLEENEQLQNEVRRSLLSTLVASFLSCSTFNLLADSFDMLIPTNS